jgi:cellulase/cellobiase CelA1
MAQQGAVATNVSNYNTFEGLDGKGLGLCADRMPGAPEAGQWFEAHFLEMVRRAEPAL